LSGSRLPCRIRELVALPAAPRVARGTIERADPSSAVAQKVSPLAAEMPRDVCDSENLVAERDRVVVPVSWLNASAEEPVSVNPPVCRRGADVAPPRW